MKATIKDTKDHALSIKKGGLKGSKAWERLELYLKGHDNVFEMWGETCLFIRNEYKPLSNIVKSDFFF